MVLLGRHATTAEQVLEPYWRPASNSDWDQGTRPGQEPVVTSLHLAFWAPTSVSWVWSQADPQLRAQLEQAVLAAGNVALNYLTKALPVVGGTEPAQGFAASAALHATVPAEAGEVPPPLLHLHTHLVGVLDAQGRVVSPDRAAVDEPDLMRECGAAGRVELAQWLRKLGFQLDVGTGPRGRSFEITGVPEGLVRSGTWGHAGCGGISQDPGDADL